MLSFRKSNKYDKTTITDIFQDKEPPIGATDSKNKPSPLIQRNKKSLLSSPPHFEPDVLKGAAKQSSRPKSFSSFFQHLETKYFPYKQQLSYEPPSPNKQQHVMLGESSLSSKFEKRNDQELELETKDETNKSESSKGSLDGLSVKPKKQKKSSVFKSFFMSSNSSHQYSSHNKLNSADDTPKLKERKSVVQIHEENPNSLSETKSTPKNVLKGIVDTESISLSELRQG